MTLTAEIQVDEQATLRSLEIFTDKLREAARHRDAMSEQFRRLSVCESEERRATQDVNLVESRLKTLHRQVLFAMAKPGEWALLKVQLTEAQEILSMRRKELEEQREIFCVGREAQAEVVSELDEQRPRLRDNLSQLFIQRFAIDTRGLFGMRGEVCWKETEQDFAARWQKLWRHRAFDFLSHKVFEGGYETSFYPAALLNLFRQSPFRVRVQFGFTPINSKNQKPFEVGQTVSVPAQLGEAEAYEEIGRGRVVFVPENEMEAR